MQQHLALKIDVDTWRGTREGAPALAALLSRLGIAATFLFSLGPDHTGRSLRRIFRPGFLGKVRRTSVLEHYGLRTLLYGTLLPGPDIGRREAETMRAIGAAGFATGIHTWDHVEWQDRVEHASAAWTETQMQRAADRYTSIFGRPPTLHGAAGWQMNDAALRCESAIGIVAASDGRGTGPYQPVDAAGRNLGPPQFPTTLPTMDELLGADGCDAGNVDARILARSAEPQRLHVYTLHAEIEGQRLLPAFERLLAGWRRQGYRFLTMGELPALVSGAALPRGPALRGTVLGRSGTLMVQGPAA